MQGPIYDLGLLEVVRDTYLALFAAMPHAVLFVTMDQCALDVQDMYRHTVGRK